MSNYLRKKRNERIIEIIEDIDFDVVREFLNVFSETCNVGNDKGFHQLMKLIDDLQELESTVKGIPIK